MSRLAMCCGVALCSLIMAPAHALSPEELRDDVFLSVQRASASVAGKALQQAALRQMAGSPALSAMLRQRQDLTDQQTANQDVLARAVSRSGAAAEAEVAAAQARLTALRNAIAQLDLEIEAAFPSFQELTNPRPMSRLEVQAALRDDEALILVLTGQWEVFVWAISKTRADWVSAPLTRDDLDQQVRLLRRMLDVTSDNRGAVALDDAPQPLGVTVPQFDRAVAHQLYQDLLQPLEPVFRNADHLISVVDGPLTSLPLSILVASPPEGEDTDPQALRDTDWMIARYAMTTLPNVSSLRALRTQGRQPTVPDQDRLPFVGFGDPVFRYEDQPGQATGIQEETEGYTSRGAFEAVSEVAGLAPLPNTARELRRLARITGAGDDALYLGHAATEATIKSTDLSRARILAFATHGLLTGELTGLSEPALVFTPPPRPGPEDDALLTASEAAELKLSAELIILSACNTAASDGAPGAEGLSGLARAFIYAGARSILVSHWPVDDFATAQLTTGMVAEMEAGTSRSRALRQSILDLMQNTDRPDHAHPRFWSPFVLVGDG